MQKLPVFSLLALAMTAFLALLTETFPAGMLPQTSKDLRVSESFAGQLVTAYAVGALVAAIPLTTATQGWRRRPLLLIALAGFLVFNLITAFSTDYSLTLVVRLLAGMAGGLVWGMLAGYSRRMVTERLQGKAMALAMLGAPIALSFGVPAGTFLGTLVGWRNTFIIMSVIALALMVWVMAAVPDYSGQAAGRSSVGKVFLIPGVRSVLAVTTVWVLAHATLYTYIEPFLQTAGLAGRVDVALFVFGIASVVGIWITGMLVDKILRRAVMAGLLIFLLAVVLMGIAGSRPFIAYLTIALWGLAFGGSGTMLQTASADAAGDSADVAQSMLVTAWNLAIAGGGIAGGILLDTLGVKASTWVAGILLITGLLVTWCSARHGFRPGPRSALRKIPE